MAITINGSGTIAGISVGGLENGCINEADLATAAVTNTKLASNAVTIDKLGTTEQRQLCKAWVNFDGTLVTNPGSATGIRASYNVSSITDNGVGDYTVNFTSALADANYSFALSKSEAASEPSGYNATISTIGMTTTGINVRIRYNNGVIGDDDYVSVAIFR
jgi:hypothetical protein